MTTATISALEQTIEKTNIWLEELAEELGRDRHYAYRVLRSVLHTLRDHLTIEEATDLAAQLPMLVRGFYYERWNPAHTPRTDERHRDAFLDAVAADLNDTSVDDPEYAVRAVFNLLSRHCTEGQVNHVRASLPKDLRALWTL